MLENDDDDEDGRRSRQEKRRIRGGGGGGGGGISEVDGMPCDRSSWESARPPALQTGQYGGQLLLPM